MVVFLALALTIAGCACLYLASPHQKWLAQAPSRKALLIEGSVLLAIGLAAWISALRPVAGVFVTLHVAMVCLSAFPYLAVLCGAGRAN